MHICFILKRKRVTIIERGDIMHIHNEIIQAFLNDQAIENCESFPLLNDYKTPDIRRKDIVQELSSQLETIIEEFPVFNHELWKILFNEHHPLLDHIIILPVVGTQGNRICKTEDYIYILIDFIHTADYTPIVSQMVYIMQNYLTKEISKLCIHHDYPLESRHYLDILDYFTFCHGLSNFLAWNEHVKDYRFYTEKYEPYKEKAFGSLAGACDVKNKAMQHKILISATSGDLWNQFPSAAGMFYFDDIYREYGQKGIQSLYRKGPQKFIQTIFQS